MATLLEGIPIMVTRVFFVSILSSFVCVNTLVPTYNIHTECNRTVDLKKENVHLGLVTFDMTSSGSLSQTTNTCSVTIVPWFSMPNIQYYFSTIRIPSCSKSHVEIKQSSAGNVYTYPKDFTGKKCGNAISSQLYNKVFTVTERYLKVIFTWHRDAKPSTAFTIVFNTYSTGTCDSKSEYECNNKRCIVEDISCEQYNTCGDNSSCKSESVTPDSNILSEVQLLIVPVVSVIVFLCISGVIYKRFFSRDSGSISCLEGIFDCICGCISCVIHAVSRCKTSCVQAGRRCKTSCSHAGRACMTSCCSVPGRLREHSRERYGECECPCKRSRNEEEEPRVPQTEEPVPETAVYFTSISHTSEYSDISEPEEEGASGSDPRDQPPPYSDKFYNERYSVPSAPPREVEQELAPPPHYEDVIGQPAKYKKR